MIRAISLRKTTKLRRNHWQLYVLGARVRWERKLADAWVGAYWKRGEADLLSSQTEWHLYVCIVPCLPLHISWWRPTRQG